MKRRDYYSFMADIQRFRPLAVIVLSTVVIVPSLAEMLTQGMSVLVVLLRYLIALVVMTILVWSVSSLLLRYARIQERAESDGNKSGRNYL